MILLKRGDIVNELIKLANDTEIKELISKTNPVFDNNIGLTKIEAELDAGSYYFYFKNQNQEENMIRLTAYNDDIYFVLEFLLRLTNIKAPICTLVRDEGEHGIFYAVPINENQIRFVVADDYELYKRFCQYNEHYSFADAHICLDIIINKNRLIKQFYNAIWEETKNYKNIKWSPIWHGIEKRHIELFEKIKKYLTKE